MEKIDKIRTEYMLFEVDCVPECKDDVVDYFEEVADGLAYTYKSIINAKRYDRFNLFVNSFLSFWGLPTEDSDRYFWIDIDILKKYGDAVGTYEFLYQRLLASITDDNWLDIYRLGSFMENKSIATDNYYKRVFESMAVSYQGIMCIAGGEDETSVFRELFEEELKVILSKGNEKVKGGLNE